MRPGRRLAVVLAAPMAALAFAVAVVVATGGIDPGLRVSVVVAAVIAVAVAVVLGRRAARSIAEPVRTLAVDAERIAGEQLPAFVARIRAGAAEVDRPSPVRMPAPGDLARVATAFTTVQDVTLDVAEEQAALLRKGISELFVNLARRNQALLDRQIEFIDELEANERDPEQLENLFRLDHLATRMRRNAESLLVLAGAEPPRRRGRPVALAEVLRVAVGEVADYERVHLHDCGSVTVVAEAAVDLAHLLAELMDNATQYSSPGTPVEVGGEATPDGGYVLTVADRGIGMTAEQTADVNRLLAEPPVVGLQLGRSLGFVVVGRLAQRHGVTVHLDGSPGAGVTVTVAVPAAVIGEDLEPEGTVDPGTGAPVVADETSPTGATMPSGPMTPTPGAAAVLDVTDDDNVEPPMAAVDPLAAVDPPLAAVGAAPVPAVTVGAVPTPERPSAGLTGSGLARRSPKQQLRALTRGEAPATDTGRVGASQRSPEEVRQMLARYRSGLHRGRAEAPGPAGPSASDPVPPPPSGAPTPPATTEGTS